MSSSVIRVPDETKAPHTCSSALRKHWWRASSSLWPLALTTTSTEFPLGFAAKASKHRHRERRQGRRTLNSLFIYFFNLLQAPFILCECFELRAQFLDSRVIHCGKAQSHISAQILGGRLDFGEQKCDGESLFRLSGKPVGACEQIQGAGAQSVNVD